MENQTFKRLSLCSQRLKLQRFIASDDFCKKFASLQAKFMLEDKKAKRRNKPNRMNDAEIMVILILFHSGGFRRFKRYCIGHVCKRLQSLFPHVVSYNRFVELERKCCSRWPFL